MQIQKPQILNRIKISCENCGNEFEVYNCRKDTAKFCSHKCFRIYRKEKKLYPYNKPPVLIFCKKCGGEFKVSKYRRDIAKFCSYNCSGNFRKGKTYEEICGKVRKEKTYIELYGKTKAEEIKEKMSNSHKGKPAWNDLGFKLKCKFCKEEFKSAPSNKRIFCSKKCFDNFQRSDKEYRKESTERMKKIRPTINMKGKNNPQYGKIGELASNWQGGLSFEPYNKSFNNKFKRVIRKRDNQICMLCGIHREKLSQALDVHHINYDKLMSIPQNCISLCRKCNTGVNGNRSHWTKFFQSLLAERYGYQYSDSGEIILEVKNEN